MDKTKLRKILKNLKSDAITLTQCMKEIHELENPKHTGSMFQIDFFEFSFLVEACIPPNPIARSMFWQDVVDKHYHTLSDNERARLYEWISKNSHYQDSLDRDLDDTKLFEARYNPDNQYIVHADFNGVQSTTECFKMGDRYWTGKNNFMAEEYITKIEKKI